MTDPRAIAFLAAAAPLIARWPVAARIAFRNWVLARPAGELEAVGARLACERFLAAFLRWSEPARDPTSPGVAEATMNRLMAVGVAHCDRQPVEKDPAALAAAFAGTRDQGARLETLLAVAIAALRGRDLDEWAIEAIDDDLLIDAALRLGAEAAVTGVAIAAAERLPDRVRDYLGIRFEAAAARGVHVAAIHFANGNATPAARALAPDLARCLPDQIGEALAILACVWSEASPPFAPQLAAALPPSAAAKVAAWVSSFIDHPDLNAALGARAASPD